VSCGFENPEELKFCNECGVAFKRRCPSCGFENAPQAKFCGECGAALTGKSKGKRQKSKGKSENPKLGTQNSELTAAERRQLTVMFCDLVGSTALSEQLDPEEWREVVRAYQQTCAEVVSRFDGHIAQYLGDGLLIYFGYPTAHEDDAQRAVRAGLEIVAALQKQVSSPLRGEACPEPSRRGQGEGVVGATGRSPLQVRIGIHTGLVVIGDIGASGRTEQLALGDTPNIAARLQGLAEPNTVVISAATHRLIAGFFDCHDNGLQSLKGVSAPVQVYCVLNESSVQSRLEVEVSTGRLTPLVGRTHEVGLILERWTAAQAGNGQVVLLNGEPGIGKSRLVQEVRERLLQQEAAYLEFRCSPYHQNSALYPVITHLQRLLGFQSGDSPEEKLHKLEVGARRAVPLQPEAISFLAALLSLPHPEGAPPLTLSPQKQKQKTQEALVAWLVEEAERAPVYCVWEDVHWADPSTLEFLGFLLDQVPTTHLLVLLTARPEFTPPWSSRTHLTPLTLARLPRTQAAEMIEKVTGGKSFPAEVQHQIVSKTDGVPLFVEELTKMVLESGLLREEGGQYVGAHGGAPIPPLAIPATLHDSLMARLDRLATVKEIAQLGATLGREFSYELIHAVAPGDEANLQRALAKLVEAEVLYQRGLPPQARYIFKHALIQDAAYQSLLKSRRHQYHQQIAQVLEERFPETIETQPELVAHHYTEASLIERAIPYWQQAGERATQRSAYAEAVAHLTKGLEVLKALPDTPERAQQELTLQLALNDALLTIKGYTVPEVEKTMTRARELCRQLGETPQLFPVLSRLALFYINRGELQTTRELAEQMMRLAQSVQDRSLLSWAHSCLECTLHELGELVSARPHWEQAIALYDPQKHPRPTAGTADPRVDCLSYMAWILWLLGYPEQALKRSHEALAVAAGLSHPFSLAYALGAAAWFHLLRREEQVARERAEAVMTLSAKQGFPNWLAYGTTMRGSVLAEQGQVEEGIAQLRQGLAAFRAMGAELVWRDFLPLLAAAYAKVGWVEEGLSVVAEALALVDKTGARVSEAELYRLKGELTLQQNRERATGNGQQGRVTDPRALTPDPQNEAEECFLRAIEVARKQQAKSLELRAVMSLVRLRQQQVSEHGSRNTQHEARARLDAARTMLSDIYNWFTEGFDTKDLQEAKALLESLSS
jgi:class 3 adenylate cyclase/predicted ATPase